MSAGTRRTALGAAGRNVARSTHIRTIGGPSATWYAAPTASSSSGRAARYATRGRMTSRSTPLDACRSPITNSGWGDRPWYSSTTATGRPCSSATPQRVRPNSRSSRSHRAYAANRRSVPRNSASISRSRVARTSRPGRRIEPVRATDAIRRRSRSRRPRSASSIGLRASRSARAAARPARSVGSNTPISVTMRWTMPRARRHCPGSRRAPARGVCR